MPTDSSALIEAAAKAMTRLERFKKASTGPFGWIALNVILLANVLVNLVILFTR